MAASDPHPRPSAEDFHFGAQVFSSDGRHIGALSSMIVDSDSFDVHAIVVKETHHFSGRHAAGTAMMEEEIAIPIGSVAEVGRDRITLSVTSAAARRTEPYLSYRYVPLERADATRLLVAELSQTAFPPELVEEAHKRLDELEIRRGENVMLGRTGRRLGTVRDVVMDDGELVGVVVHGDGASGGDVLLQVRFLGRSDDLALFAQLTEADLAHLPPFHPGQ
jgi:sporulation protein YlmC with PRC-barrel domain